MDQKEDDIPAEAYLNNEAIVPRINCAPVLDNVS